MKARGWGRIVFISIAAAGGARLFKFARPTSLLQRFIEPGEVAAMVTYICSPRSAATNGAALRVEGGVVRTLT